MVDESGAPDASQTAPSEEWLASIADAEGIPRDEVIERLLSSYWTLMEVTDLVGDLEEDIEGDADAKAPDTAEQTDTSDGGTLASDLADLREQLDRFDADLAAAGEARADLGTDLGKLTQRIDAVEKQLEDRHRTLESRLDAELENLRTILEYLIDRTDAVDADLGAISEDVVSLRRRQEEADRLADLTRVASRIDVRSATCDHCEATVDIGLIPSADCPHCDRSFVDIAPARGWFGLGSATLVTRESREPDHSDSNT